jgi:hypothetical protein
MQYISRLSENVLKVCRVVESNKPEGYVGSLFTVYRGHIARQTGTKVSETRDTDIAGTSDECVLFWHKNEGKTYLEMSVNVLYTTHHIQDISGHIPHLSERLKSQRVINSVISIHRTFCIAVGYVTNSRTERGEDIGLNQATTSSFHKLPN